MGMEISINVNERAWEVSLTSCAYEKECYFAQKKSCIELNLSFNRCPYMQTTIIIPHTVGERERWIRRAQELEELISPAVQKMAIIGEFVYLPYSYVTRINGAGFLGEGIGEQALPFIPIHRFNSETVVQIANFIPLDKSGRDVFIYTNFSVPFFLQELKDLFPDLYREAVQIDPEIKNKTALMSGTKTTNVVD